MPLWRLDELPLGRQLLNPRQRHLFRQQGIEESIPARLQMAGNQQFLAASDGQYAWLCHPILGQLLAEPIRISPQVPYQQSPVLAADESGAVFIGRNDQGALSVTMLNADGALRWRQVLGAFSRIELTSTPSWSKVGKPSSPFNTSMMPVLI